MYLGQVDPVTRKIVHPGWKPSKEKLILDFGDSFFVTRYMQENLKEIYAFLKTNNALSLVLYKILGKGSMRRAHAWYEGNIIRYLAPSDLRSQRISDFLKEFGDESLISSFYTTYLKAPEIGISIDTTSLPNQIDLDITQWGYSSETMEEEIKLLLVMDRDRNRSLYFRYLPGSILDVSVLETTRSEIESLGIRSSLTIMGAGFFSENNIGSMCDMKQDFLIRVPANRSIYRDAIDRSSYIEDPDKAVKYGSRILFIQSAAKEFSGHSICVHTFLDPERRGRELRRYLLKHPNDYASTVKRKGFMVLMSSSHINREDLIPLYYSRQYVEKAFSYSKDDLSLLSLRVYSKEFLRGYLFITFLSLIVYMEIQKRLESVELSMDILRNIKCKVYDKEIVVQELTKDQKKMFEKIGVIVPNVMGI